MDVAGVVPGVSYSADVSRGVSAIDEIVESVGLADATAFGKDFLRLERAMTGMATSFSCRLLPDEPERTTISSSDASSKSDEFAIDVLDLAFMVFAKPLRVVEVSAVLSASRLVTSAMCRQ